MASSWPPKKHAAFTLYFTLYKNDGTVVANPGTITKKVSIDGAAVADIAASVTEEDTTYGQLSLVLSADEMNGDAIWVYITDDTAGTVPFTATLYTVANTQDELGTAIADIPTVSEFEARTLAAANYFDPAADTVVNVTNVAAIGTSGITAASIATGAIDADALAADAVDEILDEVVEGTITLRQALRVLLAFVSGKASGGGTGSTAFRDQADTKDRISMTVDANGNRSAVTVDGS